MLEASSETVSLEVQSSGPEIDLLDFFAIMAMNRLLKQCNPTNRINDASLVERAYAIANNMIKEKARYASKKENHED